MHNLSQPKRVGAAAGDEPLWLKTILILASYLIMTVLILVPVVFVFTQALSAGWESYIDHLWNDPDTRHSIYLTMVIAPIAVILNTIFGIAAAWAIARFQFPGRTLLVTMLDIPFAISPVVVGLMFVLIFGMQGYLGPTLREWGIKVIFAWPGLVLATTFVTLPFIARELIPLMEALGEDEEVAAISLGANGWQMFWRITLPNIRWGLLYGVIQCFSRDWRVWCRVCGFRSHRRRNRHDAPARGKAVSGIQQPRVVCGGISVDHDGAVHADR